jgi:hypothetical protein
VSSVDIDEEPGGLLIKIPVPRSAAQLGGWAGGLGAWLAATAAGAGLFDGVTPGGRVATLLLWLAPGAALLVGLLYRAAGREVIRLTKTHLEIRHEVFGLGSTERIDVSAIRALRYFGAASEARLFGLPAGSMAYEYAAGTRWFGEGVTIDDAQRLVTAFQRRFRLPNLLQAGDVGRVEGAVERGTASVGEPEVEAE